MDFEHKGQNPLHQFPHNKSVTSWQLSSIQGSYTGRAVATAGYIGIYTPKIRPGKFRFNGYWPYFTLLSLPKKFSGYAPGYRETCVMDFGRNQPVLPVVTVAEPLFSICLRQRLKAS